MLLSDILAEYPNTEFSVDWVLTNVLSNHHVNHYDNVPLGHPIAKDVAKRFLMHKDALYVKRFVDDFMNNITPGTVKSYRYVTSFYRHNIIPVPSLYIHIESIDHSMIDPNTVYMQFLMDKDSACKVLVRSIKDKLTEHYMENMRYVFGPNVTPVHHILLLAIRDKNIPLIDYIMSETDKSCTKQSKKIVSHLNELGLCTFQV